MQQFTEFFLQNQETIIQCGVCILVLFSTFLLIQAVSSQICTDESLLAMPTGKRLKFEQKFKKTQYLEKSFSKVGQDLNRFGRFKVTYKNGKTGTKIGILQDILSNINIKTYRQIK